MANEVKRTSFVWDLDANKYNKSLKDIKRETSVARSEFKLAESSLKAFGKSTEGLAKKQQTLTKQIELHNKSIDIYTKSMDKSNKKVQEGVTKRKELEENLKKTTDAYKKVVAEQGKESQKAQELKSKIADLKKEYNENEKSIENNTKKSANNQRQINNTQAEINKLEAELKQVNGQLDKNTNKLLLASKGLDNFGNKAQKIGGGLNSVGNGILSVTAPLALGIAAATKQFMEFEKGVAKTGTIADTTKLSLEQIKDGIIELSNQTGVATEDLNEAMYQALSAGVDTADAISFLAEANYLAKGGFTSTTSAVDLLTTVLNAYGLEAEKTTEVSDMLISTQNLGKTSVDQLASSMGKVIPTAKAGGVEFKQLSTSVALLTQKGIATSESVTYLNSMINELSKSGTSASKNLKEATGKTFQQLMKDGTSLGDVMVSLEKHAKKSGKGLGDMFGSAEAGKAALTLASEGGKEFNSILKEMENSAGATKIAYEKMMDTKSENLGVAVNKLKNNFMKLGEAAVPMVDELAKIIGKLADFLGNLSDEQLKNIVNFAKWGVIAGGSAKILGGTVSTVGTLSKGLGKLTGVLGNSSKATKIFGGATSAASGAKGVGGLGKASVVASGSKGIGALVKSVGTATKLFSPWGLAIAGATTGAVVLGKKLKEEVVPEVDLFADKMNYAGDGTLQGATKISEATKQAVGAYMEMDKKALTSLSNVYYNSTKITSDTATSLKTQYSEMGKAITTELDKDYKNNLSVMQSFLEQSNVLNEEEKAQYLEVLRGKYNSEKEETTKAQEEINLILDTASKQKRALKEEEWRRITELQENMKVNAVECMTAQEEETNLILSRMASYNGRVTTEMALEHVKQLENARIKAVDEATKEYNERVKVAEAMRVSGVKNAEELANKMISEAERQRKEVIDKATSTKEDGIDELAKSYANLRADIDTDSIKIRSSWDKIKSWWESWIPSRKEFPMREATTNDFKGVNQGTGGKSRTVRNRSYDTTAYAPATLFNSRLTEVNRNNSKEFDYNRLEKMVKSIEDTMKLVLDNKEGIYLDSDKLVGATILKTDRELARQQAINSYGFK